MEGRPWEPPRQPQTRSQAQNRSTQNPCKPSHQESRFWQKWHGTQRSTHRGGRGGGGRKAVLRSRAVGPGLHQKGSVLPGSCSGIQPKSCQTAWTHKWARLQVGTLGLNTGCGAWHQGSSLPYLYCKFKDVHPLSWRWRRVQGVAKRRPELAQLQHTIHLSTA